MVVSSLLSLMKDQVKLITENSLSAINPAIKKTMRKLLCEGIQVFDYNLRRQSSYEDLHED